MIPLADRGRQDEGTIRTADHIANIDRGATEHGGYIVATGNLDDIVSEAKSRTATTWWGGG